VSGYLGRIPKVRGGKISDGRADLEHGLPREVPALPSHLPLERLGLRVVGSACLRVVGWGIDVDVTVDWSQRLAVNVVRVASASVSSDNSSEF
jgi:hypothetical protein